jgi:DNA gyrase subunit A
MKIKHKGDNNMIALDKLVKENMMEYTGYLVQNRVLPSIEDGYKPIYRYIVWTMEQMKAYNFTKSQNVEGQVMNYSPHGGSYDTMVNMTTKNYQNIQPLIGKGNFGDATSRDLQYAAQRYTEVKMSPMIREMINGIKNKEVEMMKNFDGTKEVPKFIPFKYPNILCNNVTGIGVGLATKIPSFNMKEVCQATIDYIDGKVIKPLIPDFPTGGEIIKDEEALTQLNVTGKASIKIKGKATISGNTIEITEIPYTTTREAIIEKIIDLTTNNTLNISDVIDTTGKDGMSITVICKKSADPQEELNKIFALTPLIDNLNANMNILVDGSPVLLGTRDIIKEWVNKRRVQVEKGIKNEIKQKREKLHILKGLEKILLSVDKAVEIIRYSEEPETDIMNYFEIDETQAKEVCDMALRNINNKHIEKKIKEVSDLEKEISKLENTPFDLIIKTQLMECMNKYGVERSTDIVEFKVQKLEKKVKEKVQDNSMYRVALTKEGYIHKLDEKSRVKINVKPGDKVVQETKLSANDKILVFGDNNKAYRIAIKDIKGLTSGLGVYAPVAAKDDFKVLAIMVDTSEGYLLVSYETGKLSKTKMSAFESSRKVLTKPFHDKHLITNVEYIAEDMEIELIGEKRNKVINTSTITAKSTKASQGVNVLTAKNKLVSFKLNK